MNPISYIRYLYIGGHEFWSRYHPFWAHVLRTYGSHKCPICGARFHGARPLQLHIEYHEE